MKDYLTDLLILDAHKSVKHNGVRETLNEFLSKYWLKQARNNVKKVLFNCVRCKYLNSRPYPYPEAPELPVCRVKDDFAFANIGVDHFGPLYCKPLFHGENNEDDLNSYHVVSYTCTTSRGLLLDLVPNTSAEQFLQSFRRFCGRRGAPKMILSDNGSAFTSELIQNYMLRA